MAEPRDHLTAAGRRIVAEFEAILAPSEPDLERFRSRVAEFMELEGDQPDLRAKDVTLINMVARYEWFARWLFRRGAIDRPQLFLALGVVAMFEQLESILWELKGLPGKPPKPDPIPEPNDDDDAPWAPEPHPEWHRDEA